MLYNHLSGNNFLASTVFCNGVIVGTAVADTTLSISVDLRSNNYQQHRAHLVNNGDVKADRKGAWLPV